MDAHNKGLLSHCVGVKGKCIMMIKGPRIKPIMASSWVKKNILKVSPKDFHYLSNVKTDFLRCVPYGTYGVQRWQLSN